MPNAVVQEAPTTARDPRAIARGLRPLVESEAQRSDQSLTLSAPLVEAFAESGLFHLMVPREFGGAEADTDTILDVFADLAWADGSVGWSLMANASSTSYVSFLAPEAGAAMVRGNPLGCSAGMYAPLGGQAHKEGSGFRVSGNYSFGSGCAHATHFGGGAFEFHDGQMAPPDETGFPAMLCYYVPREKVEIRSNWDTLGLWYRFPTRIPTVKFEQLLPAHGEHRSALEHLQLHAHLEHVGRRGHDHVGLARFRQHLPHDIRAARFHTRLIDRSRDDVRGPHDLFGAHGVGACGWRTDDPGGPRGEPDFAGDRGWRGGGADG